MQDVRAREGLARAKTLRGNVADAVLIARYAMARGVGVTQLPPADSLWASTR